MRKLNVFTKIGIILAFLAMSGVAEAVTGRGDINISLALLIIGFLVSLFGYVA